MVSRKNVLSRILRDRISFAFDNVGDCIYLSRFSVEVYFTYKKKKKEYFAIAFDSSRQPDAHTSEYFRSSGHEQERTL